MSKVPLILTSSMQNRTTVRARGIVAAPEGLASAPSTLGIRPAEVSEADGSDSEPNEEVPLDDDSSDYMTDNGIEAEVEHDVEEIRWKPSKAWAKESEGDAFKAEMGNAVSKSPAIRSDVVSLPTGPEQDPTFNIDTTRPAIELLLDALPVNKFWKPLARLSWLYAQQQHDPSVANPRPVKKEWFTAANYLRCYAVIPVIMSGLVEARDNPELFAGSTRCGGRFRRTGAATVCKIKLNVYQQLMRFKHMVNNIMKKSPSDENFDKLFHVRPMITMLQQTFERWFNPPKDNSMDEAGIPSRSKWMRTFNGSKPCKYFIELLMACCATTRFCWAFFVTESALKTIMNRHRRGRNKSKFKKVVHYQYEYTDVERRFQDRFGSATAQMLYFARILRERHPSQVTYRLFVDRRWDSLSAIVLAKKIFNISFTAAQQP